MTWPAIRDAIGAGCATVVVAVGATEQHGPHLRASRGPRVGFGDYAFAAGKRLTSTSRTWLRHVARVWPSATRM